jgi:carboxyl-terminal processing protease
MDKRETRFALAGIAIALSLLAGCATQSFAPSNVTYDAEIRLEDRRAGFTRMMNALKEDFYDPQLRGLNWQALYDRYAPDVESAKTTRAYYDVMSRLAAEVGDSHVYVRPPVETQDRKGRTVTGLGVSVRFIGDELLVLGVRKDGPAERAGIKRGMVVDAIDGRSAQTIRAEINARTPATAHPSYASRQLSRLTRLPVGTVARWTVREGAGREADVARTVEIVSASVPVEPPTRIRVDKRADNVTVIRIAEVGSEPLWEFREIIAANKNAAGIIIDLRGNPGGAVIGAQGVIDPFLDTAEEFARFKLRPMNKVLSVLAFMTTDSSMPLVTGRLFEREYAGPLVVLIDESTASAAEMIAASLQDYAGAKVVGRRSCGCVTGLFGFSALPGGGEFAVSRMQVIMTKRGSIERVGVTPDVEVPITRGDLRTDRDVTMQAALTLLRDAHGLRGQT